ncbi:MAG: 50S ribosomal protein L22, partial [Phycisphaerales bacterium]
ANELKSRATEAGVSVEQLAEAVSRDGLTGDKAVSAVRNWMGGKAQPRCTRQDIEAMATAVGCLPKDIAKFTSQVKNHRGSPKKAKLVADMIRGKSFEDASNMLGFSTKRAAVNIKKALDAAAADAEQLGADPSAVFVSEVTVDRGMHIKRFRPKDRGRAHPIHKRTSHITLSVQERN